MVVSISGFRDFKKNTDRDLTLLGVNLKGKADLDKWLADYVPSENGLWVPSPKSHPIPEL